MLATILQLLLSVSQTRNVSAFCAGTCCCGPNARGITASGAKARYGTIAAPRNIPFGTRMYVPGYGMGVVEDRGGAIKGNKLDVFFPDEPGKLGSGHQKALHWGRRRLRVQFGSRNGYCPKISATKPQPKSRVTAIRRGPK